MASRMTATDAHGDLTWAENAIRRHYPQRLTMQRVALLPSRTGRLHSLDVTLDDQPQRFFLKRYTPAAVSSWTEHAEHLMAIARLFNASDPLLRCTLVAADAERQVALTVEMPGEQLTRSADQCAIWRRVGSWLAALHAGRPCAPSTTRAPELVGFAEKRFRAWVERDPVRAPLAADAIAAARQALNAVGGGITMALCHGDITSNNIVVQKNAVGLIDFDDVRIDLPAIDLSQAELEIEELSCVASLVLIRGASARAKAAFRAGYGSNYAKGPEFWLPHLRNLSVFLLTLAERRAQRGIWQRVSNEVRYRRTIAELERTIDEVAHSLDSSSEVA